MKKAWSYMSIGALGATLVMMYMNNKSSIDKSVRKMKKNSKDAYSKVKAMFE